MCATLMQRREGKWRTAVRPVVTLIQLNNPYRSKKLELLSCRGMVGGAGGDADTVKQPLPK
jgi:hypothetical protein